MREEKVKLMVHIKKQPHHNVWEDRLIDAVHVGNGVYYHPEPIDQPEDPSCKCWTFSCDSGWAIMHYNGSKERAQKIAKELAKMDWRGKTYAFFNEPTKYRNHVKAVDEAYGG